MRDSWFWRVVACAALLIALGYVGTRFDSAPPVRAAQGGSIIAVTEVANNVPRLFLIDTSRSVILVYGGSNAYNFTLLASRYYEKDAIATVGKEFPFKTSGYKITDMEKHIK